VSFVDKIVFGRLNYNVKSSEFKYTKEFYNSLAASVIKFCRKNKINYHIKQVTQIIKEVIAEYPQLKEEDIHAAIAYGAEMSRERYVEIPH
jgi:hypothetical protein